MLSIKATVVCANTIIVSMILCGFAALVFYNTKETALAKIDARLASHAEKIATELEEYTENHQPIDTTELRVLRTDGLSSVQLYIVHIVTANAAGVAILSDSLFASEPNFQFNSSSHFNPSDSLNIASVVASGRIYRLGQTTIVVGNHPTFLLSVAAPMDDITADLRRLVVLFCVVIPTALVVMGVAAYLVARRALQPVTTMMQTAERITANNLGERLQLPRTRDEVYALGITLNGMMERIDAAFKSQKQFIADASHEIRTPLTIMQCELEFAMQHLDNTAMNNAATESIHAVQEEIERLTRLTEGLLVLANLDAAQLQMNIRPVRFDEVVIECVQRLSPLAARNGIQLTLHIEEAIELQADREKIGSVVFNLVDNAIKYSQQGGTVVILLDFGTNPDRVILTVADTGRGIAPDDKEHIFKRFYRADRDRAGSNGSGLGLAIVEQMVRLHRGTISVQSELGNGATFVVEIPTAVTMTIVKALE